MFKNIVDTVKKSELEERGFGFDEDSGLEKGTARYFISHKFKTKPNFMGLIYSFGTLKDGSVNKTPRCQGLSGEWRYTYNDWDFINYPMLEIMLNE